MHVGRRSGSFVDGTRKVEVFEAWFSVKLEAFQLGDTNASCR